MQQHGISDDAPAGGRDGAAIRDRFRDLGSESHFRPGLYLSSLRESDIARSGRDAGHIKLQGVSIAVRDIRAPCREARAPLGKVNALGLPELHVDAPLSDAAAAHAGKICLATDFQWKSAIQDDTSNSIPGCGPCP